MKNIIKQLLENRYFKDAESFKQILRMTLVSRIGILKTGEVLEGLDAEIEAYFQEVEAKREAERQERRAKDPVFCRVMSYWDYKEKQKVK